MLWNSGTRNHYMERLFTNSNEWLWKSAAQAENSEQLFTNMAPCAMEKHSTSGQTIVK